MALLDSELVGEHIVRALFPPAGDVVRTPDGEMRQRYRCPKCNTMCEEEYDEFSISMRRSHYRFPDSPDLADVGLYLVGIRAFSGDDFQRVPHLHGHCRTNRCNGLAMKPSGVDNPVVASIQPRGARP
jgi:hypothetical protein